jgi:hypothetical protein
MRHARTHTEPRRPALAKAEALDAEAAACLARAVRALALLVALLLGVSSVRPISAHRAPCAGCGRYNSLT